jgi:penicillin-binding protein 1C
MEKKKSKRRRKKQPKKLLARLVSRRRIAIAILFASFFFLLSSLYLFWGLPLPTKLTSWQYPVSTKIYAHDGQLLYEIYTEQNRTPIRLGDLPDYVKWATISSEDKDFYRHHGFSWRGIARASFNIVFKRQLQGGSTITQQLVKNALLTPERTLKRKIREFALTLAVEVIYPKDKILEMYFNHVPYGGTAWGIESASKLYFDKSSKDLTLAEATLLAGLPASPTRYSPFGAHPELAKERQKFVLRRMVEDEHINQEEAEKAENEELLFASHKNNIQAPHFVMHVKEQLVEKYGERMVEQGGLRVTTSLDLDIQTFAETAIASEVAKLENYKVSNAAALVTKPKTGEILAMVGSKDYFDRESQGNFNVTTALRQPGSAIKPLNYALALMNKKLTLATVINDVPTCFAVTGQKLYCPSNYDGQFHGPVQARFALGSSYNLPAVKVLALNGLEDFVAFANKMGLTTLEDPSLYGLSLTLGGGEVRMIDMAVAFGTLANLGVKQPLVSILKVEDYQGKVHEEWEVKEGERIIPMEVAFLVSHILLDNNARAAAFGTSSYLVIRGHPEVSVKTGTTNDKRDNWTIGYNPEFLVATWVGNNDNSPMARVASGVTGASPIWNKVMSYVLKEEKQVWQLKPDGIYGTQVCAISGFSPNQEGESEGASPLEALPTGEGEGGCQTRFEYFLKDTGPGQMRVEKQFVEIDKTTGQLATDKTPPENKEMQEKQILTDLWGIKYCLDCIFPSERTLISYPLKTLGQTQLESESKPQE